MQGYTKLVGPWPPSLVATLHGPSVHTRAHNPLPATAQLPGCPPHPGRQPITNISQWMERYSLMVATLASRFPRAICLPGYHHPSWTELQHQTVGLLWPPVQKGGPFPEGSELVSTQPTSLQWCFHRPVFFFIMTMCCLGLPEPEP